jgi:hypothetical protein
MKTILVSLGLLASLQAGSIFGQTHKYAPFSEIAMAPEAEIALARSAAPDNISSHATVKILTPSGFKVAAEGDNGFVCIVMRGWGAPTFSPAFLRDMVYDPKMRAPICFNPVAVKTVLPLQEFRTKLGLEGKTPDEITAGVQAAYSKGELPKMDTVALAYMFSADQYLGPMAGHWHPHVMIYAPNWDNGMVGGNQIGGPLPAITDDGGTPFAVIVIPVDPAFFVKTAVK